MKTLVRGAVAAAIAVGLLSTAQAQNSTPARKVRIDSGVIVGQVQNGVATYKGVPFAKPPVGALRWRPPQRITWTGERQATTFALPCPQAVNASGAVNGGGVAGAVSEDCLYLNVFAPANARNAPVMLWLYGGAGYLGAGHLGTFQGDSFARQGVIVVTINYRLGALGNFAHPTLTREFPNEPHTNYALMDAIAGLEWVQRNIGQFGGDKTNVTLFGQSAGGSMVSSLLASPPAGGLYHKAIIHSGANLGAGTTQAAGEARGVTMATQLGLPGANATLDQLRSISPAEFYSNAQLRGGVTGVLDGKIRTIGNGDALRAGTAHDVPLIVGSNSGEGGADGANTMVNLAAGGRAGAWQYYFGYVPAWRAAEWAGGTPHSGELAYTWDSMTTSSMAGGANVTDRDRAVARRVNSCWVAFAKMPAASKTIPCAEGFSWAARTNENDAVALFNESPTQARMTPILQQIAARAPARGAAAAPVTAPAGRGG